MVKVIKVTSKKQRADWNMQKCGNSNLNVSKTKKNKKNNNKKKSREERRLRSLSTSQLLTAEHLELNKTSRKETFSRLGTIGRLASDLSVQMAIMLICK